MIERLYKIKWYHYDIILVKFIIFNVKIYFVWIIYFICEFYILLFQAKGVDWKVLINRKKSNNRFWNLRFRVISQ